MKMMMLTMMMRLAILGMQMMMTMIVLVMVVVVVICPSVDLTKVFGNVVVHSSPARRRTSRRPFGAEPGNTVGIHGIFCCAGFSFIQSLIPFDSI